MRRAVTLLELTISMAIIGMLMVALLQTWMTMRSYSSQQTASQDLVLESRRLVEAIVTDLGASTWYIPGRAAPENGPDTNPPANELATPARDRAIRYYPFIQVQRTAGLGAEFVAHHRLLTAEIPTVWPAGVPADHRVPSQEIIFLKVRTAPASPAPARAVEIIDFNAVPPTIAQFTGNRNAAPDATTPTSGNGGGVVVPGLRLNVDPGGNITDVPMVWDSHLPSPTGDQYREYTYVVVPSPGSGKTQLERRYRNGCTNSTATSAPLRLDRVLSTNVDRIQFDTCRTDSRLNLNQIRVTLWLSREIVAQPGIYITQRVEVTAALRSTSDGFNPVDLQTRLGPGGSFGVP